MTLVGLETNFLVSGRPIINEFLGVLYAGATDHLFVEIIVFRNVFSSWGWTLIAEVSGDVLAANARPDYVDADFVEAVLVGGDVGTQVVVRGEGTSYGNKGLEAYFLSYI